MNSTPLKDIKRLESAFIELIHKRFGLVIHVNQTQLLAETIAAACTQFNYSPQEYLDHLKSCSSKSASLANLLAAITVGESYFFRDKNQMNLLEKTLLPQLINRRTNDHSLKIWSAGCSSGEEIYTIAMLLTKLIPDLDAWDLYLIGTDINAAALEKALAGRYGQWSMRSIPDHYMQRYFSKSNRSYYLTPEIRQLVHFKYLNLCDNSYPSIINGVYDVDLILCRNVLLYFDNDLVAKIMKKLSTCMGDGSYLVLGASDPIITSGTNLVFHHDGAIYFSLDTTQGTEKDFE